MHKVSTQDLGVGVLRVSLISQKQISSSGFLCSYASKKKPGEKMNIAGSLLLLSTMNWVMGI